ncbi:DUF2637 domain-containing protein [Streptomyces sp. NPDC048638]|uniref:DUF2637 domain-containing protein n=1 Tax=Streptomyces sp. NPDC048638 TaxID=3365580 RepID=UPI00371E9FB1
MNKAQRVIVGIVVGGTVVIAGIGFAGSYTAVRDLAVRKGFGTFAHVFPLGVDAGIIVLLALDLLLTWLRIPFPMLRHTAWLLTGATIAFNAASAWPDPLGVGMHSVIPVLFVVAVEAARHAIGRIADITADRHIEGVRLMRWLLSPLPTFLLWRRMKLWELRSYDHVIDLEQQRLVYQARLRIRFGRWWRRKAPVESLLPLKLARYGVPLDEGRALVSPGSPQPGAAGALDAHVAEALAVTTPTGSIRARAGQVVNVAPRSVNADAEPGVNAASGSGPTSLSPTVNAGPERESGTVNPAVDAPMNAPVHAIHATGTATVNPPASDDSRSCANGPQPPVDSRWTAFTAPVNADSLNRVNCVNPLLTGTVNAFAPIVKPREFTRERGSVNRGDWRVNRPVKLTVNGSADRESAGVNDPSGTVNPDPNETVNDDAGDREEDNVNGRTVNSRSPRVHAAKPPAPTSVHAPVGAPSREQAERAKAAAAWHKAKKNNKALTQKEFAESLSRSPAWLTKALQEARRAGDAAGE